MRTIERNELTDLERRLLDTAEQASATATATYSNYPVGASVLVETPDGEQHIVAGNNYETLTMKSVCAEKHALMKALAEHSRPGPDGTVKRPRVVAVGVFCARAGAPQQPCGDCRQTLFEVNGDMKVVSASGPTRQGDNDPRIAVTTIRELLPYGFELPPDVADLPEAPQLYEPSSAEEFVVHFPHPRELEVDRDHRVSLLQNVEYLLLVGSPDRARKVAALAHERFAARHTMAEACYCDLAIEGRDESHREFAVYVVDMPDMPAVAVVSHGVGRAGVEIAISEVPALLETANGSPPTIHGVVRSGTRGTLSRVPLGSIALSTATCNDALDRLEPSPMWLDLLRRAADDRGMTRVAEADIDGRGDSGWAEAPQQVLAEGLGLSTSFFWRGQGRPVFVPGGRYDRGPAHNSRIELLTHLVRYGVRWIEMEDYTVHEVAAACGYPSASLGAVIARRRAADGHFQVDYSKEMYAASELVPTELALAAFRRHAREAR